MTMDELAARWRGYTDAHGAREGADATRIRRDGGKRGPFRRVDADGYLRDSDCVGRKDANAAAFGDAPEPPVALPSLDGYDGETFAEKWAARHKALLARESEVGDD